MCAGSRRQAAAQRPHRADAPPQSRACWPRRRASCCGPSAMAPGSAARGPTLSRWCRDPGRAEPAPVTKKDFQCGLRMQPTRCQRSPGVHGRRCWRRAATSDEGVLPPTGRLQSLKRLIKLWLWCTKRPKSLPARSRAGDTRPRRHRPAARRQLSRHRRALARWRRSPGSPSCMPGSGSCRQVTCTCTRVGAACAAPRLGGSRRVHALLSRLLPWLKEGCLLEGAVLREQSVQALAHTRCVVMYGGGAPSS